MTLLPNASSISTGAPAGFRFQREEKLVLVADLVESVSLMEADEIGVIERWQSFLEHLRNAVLSVNKGRMVKSLGDGFMIEFEDASCAVASAFAMHRWFADQEWQGVRPMSLRIGLHATHVYEGEHDIYGTGVNLAARIAALAAPGHTILTASARDRIVDGLDGLIEDLGDWYLKHLEEPVHVYDVQPSDSIRSTWTYRPSASLPRPVIAVLPFQARTPELAEFSLGNLIAEGVIGLLSRTRELQVISHLSTSAFQGRETDTENVQAYLGAQFVLSGSFVLAGSQLLVLAEFTRIENREVLWAERVNGEVGDLMQMQSEICATIANGCHQTLLDREAREALVRPLPSLRSYSLLLGGIGLMHRSAPSQFMRTRAVLEDLIHRHGQCALPRIWLAKWYVLCSTRGLTDNAQADAHLALQETQRALEAEPDSSLAWAMQGFVYCHLIKDVDLALQSCARALEWNTNESLAWLFKGIVHAFDGNGAEALPAGMHSLELSPLDPLRYYYDSLMASIAISAERYDLAIRHAEQSLRVNASHLSSYRALILAQSLAGHADSAQKTVARLLEKDPHFTVARFAQAYPSRNRVPAYLERLKDAFRAAGVPEG